jgi:general secretion pathway protein L
MSHTIVGIDLGAYTVKFAMVEAGFRQARMAGSFEEEVPPGDAPLVERQGEALQRGLARLPQESTIFVGMPGDSLAIRVLDLPFSDPRKIDQVVGYELEGQIVHALSDVVFDHVVLRAPAAEGTGVLTVAAKLDDVGGFLAELGTQGIDPRALYASPVVYQALMEDEARADDGALPPCRMVLDIGHLRSNVCIVQGSEAIFGRTILRGGAALTTAIGRAYQATDEGLAMRAKHSHASVGSAAFPAPITREGQHMDAVLREALAPFLRDLRQTLASVRTRIRAPIVEVLLTGGGAQLRGLVQYLQEELELSVSLWAGNAAAALPGEAPAPVEGPPTEVDTRFSLASAIAWAGARGRKQIDLRRGPFVYRASFSLLRQKALHLGALAAGLVIALTLDTGMALARLGKQHDQLQAQLRSATVELFGEARTDAVQVSNLLKRGFKEEMVQLPKATAYDLLDEVSRKLPPADKIKLDIYQIDIRPKKVFIEGTVDSAAAVDEMVAKLNEIECFEEITRGSINEVSGGQKKFTLNIASKCP